MKIKINSLSEKKLILLQRNEVQSFIQKKLRKFFGRFLFTNFFVYFFNPPKEISKNISKIILSEFNEIIPHLPKESKNILDIGSGLGIIDLFLNNYYAEEAHFTLLDKNNIEKKIKYGFSDNYEAYNLLKTTERFLSNNGLKKEKIKLINADYVSNLDKEYDLIISLISMGYHYPLNKYLNILKKNSHSETVFIFDIADEHNDINSLKEIFQDVIILKKINKKHKQTRLICKKINP